MRLFTFMHGDLSLDNQVSAASSLYAEDLPEAKAKLQKLVDEMQLEGAPEGCVQMYIHARYEPTLTLHVLISPEAIANDENWEDDGEVEWPRKDRYTIAP
jgi:hypothetical protein